MSGVLGPLSMWRNRSDAAPWFGRGATVVEADVIVDCDFYGSCSQRWWADYVLRRTGHPADGAEKHMLYSLNHELRFRQHRAAGGGRLWC